MKKFILSKVEGINLLKTFTFVACFLFLFCLKTADASATEYYVAPTAQGSGNCTENNECLFVTAYVAVVPGDTILMRGSKGIYPVGAGAVFRSWYKSGNAGSEIIVKNYPNEVPLIEGIGASMGWGFQIQPGVHHLIFDGLSFTGNLGYVIQIYTAHDIIIKNCHFYDLNIYASGVISITGPAVPPPGSGSYNIIVENNTFENIGRENDSTNGGDHAIYISLYSYNITARNNYFKNNIGGSVFKVGWTDSTHKYPIGKVDIYNNIYYSDNGHFRYFFYTGSALAGIVSVYNNTVYVKCSGGILPMRLPTDMGKCEFADTFYSDNPANVIFKNNIVYIVDGLYGTYLDYYRLKGTGAETLDYNLYYPSKPSTDAGTNSKVGDPSFNNIGAKDFHLQSGSPAINKGADLSSIFATDFSGTIRPQGSAWDIGAYEYDSGSASNPADVNQDGKINIQDIQIVVKVITGVLTNSSADVNGDGTVNIKDIQAIVRAIIAP